MIPWILSAAVIGGGSCNVKIAKQQVVYSAPVYKQAAVYQNVAYQQHYAPVYQDKYFTQAALVYKSEDPEKSALYRQNEKLTDAVIRNGERANAKVEKLESLLSQAPPPDEPQRQSAPPSAANGLGAPGSSVAQNAFKVLQKHCLSCHGENKSAASNMTLAPFPNAMQRLLINAAVNGDGSEVKTMPPPDKPKLTDEERAVIEKWAEVSNAEIKRLGAKASANDPPQSK